MHVEKVLEHNFINTICFQNVVILSYDVTDRKLFDDVNYMIHQVGDVEFQGPILLLGTKVDLQRTGEEKHVSTIEV